MLAGCSSTLLSSPRHRLRSEAAAQFQAYHIPAMSTQRLDIPCTFASRKDGSRPQPVMPVSLSIEKPSSEVNRTSGCSLRQSIKLPPSPAEARKEIKDEFWERGRSSLKKRYAGEVSTYDNDDDEAAYMNRVKRKRGNGKSDHRSTSKADSFWFHPGFGAPQLPFSLSCSGDEEGGGERVCFVPGNVNIMAPPLPPLSHIPWFDSVVTEITDLGEKDAERIKVPVKEGSGSSSTSSGSHDGNPVESEVGNPGESTAAAAVVVAGHNGENNHREHDCVELVSLLVACVEQIGSKNIPAVNHCLARLGELASPRGSTVHRLIAYYTEALALRVARLWPHIFHVAAPRELDRVDYDESGTALRLLNQLSPIPKFIHFTANEILLRAFEGKDRVHIIDFDVKQGLQWPSLFQSLASRPRPPSHVRITGVGESKQELIETGERLAGFAEAFNLPFDFHPVVDRLEDVRLWMLHVKEKETVAVNCVLQLHKMLYDGTGATVRDFLGLVRSTNAEVVIVAEQEAAHNGASLDARLCNSLKYYSAVFDLIDAGGLPMDSRVRIKTEEMFAREIRNIVACEGRDRSERHETFGKWREVMEQGGFRCVGIEEREALQGQMMLKMYGCEDYYSVEVQEQQQQQCREALTLRWLDQPLYTVSAWMPVDAAGASMSHSQQP
ncbi:scarecrow-like protein 28 [Andrographis paniculata]|uniref:scarecrow-like protein 28 n=1 Tax=Andrographis paniculata TaxID=175694 RepID=UPI0021E6FB53|nr:scarecrow-like protein 28 [Andrographis paniculata]